MIKYMNASLLDQKKIDIMSYMETHRQKELAFLQKLSAEMGF